MGSNQDSCTSIIIRVPLNKSTILLRIPVALILTYYIWILAFACSLLFPFWWDPEQGLRWSSAWYYREQGLMWASTPHGQFFPIPRSPGPFAALSEAYLHDHIFYLIFMHNWIWIFWIFVGSLFLSPYRINFHTLCISLQTKLSFRRIA